MEPINNVKMMEAGCKDEPAPSPPATLCGRMHLFWNDRIMERFIKANLFLICCIAAALLLIAYLAAFSCEVSWILEAKGNLPTGAYVLCTQYFIVFVATTILIHGLVTGLSWGLFAWSIIIGMLSIPELFFVMVMTTQHWGLQSIHGLTELISYLIRLVINCFALICVIPTGLKWRREHQVLSQLQNLANRLQLQTPPPSVPAVQGDSRRSSKRARKNSNLSSFENTGFVNSEPKPHGLFPPYNFIDNSSRYGSQNEFNASIFVASHTQSEGAVRGNRAQSLMDLRCTLPGLYNPRYVIDNEDNNAKYFNITVDDLKNNINGTKKHSTGTEQPSVIGSVAGSGAGDPIYCTIDGPKPQKLSRNCVSLENIDGITKFQQELSHGNNLLQNYQQQQYYLAMMGQLPMGYNAHQQIALMEQLHKHHHRSNHPRQIQQTAFNQGMIGCGGIGYGGYTNPFVCGTAANSKLSLGNESDDYRKYRDVAL